MTESTEARETSAAEIAASEELAVGDPPIKLGQLGVRDIAEFEKICGKPLANLDWETEGIPWEAFVHLVLMAAKKKDPTITEDDLNARLTFREFVQKQTDILRHIGFFGGEDEN